MPTTLPSLPEGWQWKTVAELAADEPRSITDGPFGSKLKTEHYSDAGPRVIRLQNIGDGEFLDAKAHISEEHYQTLRSHKVEAGDVVIAAMGENPPRACIVPETLGPAIVKADCIRFKPDPDHSAKFLTYALNSPGTRRRAKAIVHGVGRPRLNLGEIKAIELPVAPPDEQRRIVARLEELFSRLDAGVAALRHAKAQLKRYRQSVLAAAVTGELTREWRESKRGGGKNESRTAPNWSVATVGDTIKIIDYRGRTPPYSNAGIPHIRSANIKNGNIVSEKMKYVTSETYRQYMTRGIPQQGDLLFTTEAPLGEVTEVPVEKFCLAQRVVVLRPNPNTLLHKFLKYQIMAPDFQGRISGRGTGSTVTGISSRNFKNIPIILPPLIEQHQIVAEVEARTTAIDHLEAELDRQITRSSHLRQSALVNAFSGTI